MNVPLNLKGHVEIYIDDFMVTIVDIKDNVVWVNKTILLAIHVIRIILLSQELIPRKDIISDEDLAYPC